MVEIKDTYYYALANNEVDVSEEDLVIGVVRKPMYGITEYLDKNIKDLAPPEDLLHDFKRSCETFSSLSEQDAHNQAFEAVNFESRYREYINSSEEANETIKQLLSYDGCVWLVCFENTEKKRCHRTILKDIMNSKQ